MKKFINNLSKKLKFFFKKEGLNFEFKKIKRTKNKGFTLIEVLVSLVISSMLLISVMGSYWVLMKANKSAEISRGLQKETNFTIIRMADSIRNFSIDYEAYPIGSGTICENLNMKSCQNLCIKNNFFEYKDQNLWMNEQPLFSSKYEVEDVYFSTAPNKDPFENLADRQLQIQPRVTIFIRVTSKENPSIKQEIQTTIASRKYKK